MVQGRMGKRASLRLARIRACVEHNEALWLIAEQPDGTPGGDLADCEAGRFAQVFTPAPAPAPARSVSDSSRPLPGCSRNVGRATARGV
jgi:hypothetical protein